MDQLPIQATAFSTKICGISCYVLVKQPGESTEIFEAHQVPRYKNFIGEFKKPRIGMFVVIRDTHKKNLDYS